jgi:hypothetical protein
MAMKRKPSKPSRKTRRISTYLYDDITLGEALASMDDDLPKDPSLSDLRISLEGTDAYVYLYLDIPESDEEFDKRQTVYEEKLKKYNSWLNDNPNIISDAKKKKLEKEKKQLEERLNRDKSYLQRQLDQLNKKIEKL